MIKEEILKKIEYTKQALEIEKSINSHSGNISFLEYQLSCLEKELEENEEVEIIDYINNERKHNDNN